MPAVTASRRRSYVVVLGALSAFGPMTIDMYLPALPTMSRDLGASASGVQLTLAAFMVGLAVGQLVLGPLSDARGRRGPLLVGLVVYIVGSLGCALAPSVELLIGARALQALGAAAGIVIGRAMVRDLYSGVAMTRVFSVIMVINGLAPILAPVVGAQVLQLTGWRGVFVVLIGFGSVLLATVLVVLPDTLEVSARTPTRFRAQLGRYAALLRERSFMAYALSSGLIFAAMFAYISGSSFVLQDIYGLSATEFALVFATNALGIVALSQLNTVLVERVGERGMLAAGLVAAAAGGLGVLGATLLDLPLVVLLVAIFVVVAALGLVAPNATSLAMAEHRARAGSAAALIGVLQFVFGGLAAPLVGVAGAQSAVPMGVAMAGFAGAALLVFLTLAGPLAPGSARAPRAAVGEISAQR